MPGGVYREMISSQAEESISNAREVRVDASAIESEGDSSTGIG